MSNSTITLAGQQARAMPVYRSLSLSGRVALEKIFQVVEDAHDMDPDDHRWESRLRNMLTEVERAIEDLLDDVPGGV